METGLIFGQTEVSLICGSARGISKGKKALSDAELELPDVSEMNESRVYRLRAFSHSHINKGPLSFSSIVFGRTR